MDFCSMKRKELQSLCKKNGIPANLTNLQMATRLATLQETEKQKMLKSCLKNLEIVETFDSEKDGVKFKGGKRVRISPEDEIFEFDKTDPRARELRLLARKRRALVNSRMGKNPVLVVDEMNDVGDLGSGRKLVAVSENVGGGEEGSGRSLRRRSVVRSNADFIAQDVDNVVKETTERNLRSRGKKTEVENVGEVLTSPCVVRKVKRGRKGHEIVQGDIVESVKTPPDKMATRRSLRSRGVTAKESENIAVPLRRSARRVEKAEARRHDIVLTDHTSIKQNIDAASDLSLPAKENQEMKELCGSSSRKQKAEKLEASISTNSLHKFGTSKSEDSIGSNKSNGKVPQNVEACASEPVYPNTETYMIQENCKSVGGDSTLFSSSVTYPDGEMMGSETVIGNVGVLSEQENQLEAPCINEGCRSENAIKTNVAPIVNELVDQMLEREEATGSKERPESVSGKSEHPTSEVSGSHGLNQFVSENKCVMGGEANLEPSAQHPIFLMDGETVIGNTGVLSELKNQLEESPCINEGYRRENAIKTNPAAIVDELVDELKEREEAGSRERCDNVSGESECPTSEVSGSQGLNQYVSEKKFVGGWEANLVPVAQLPVFFMGSETVIGNMGVLSEQKNELEESPCISEGYRSGNTIKTNVTLILDELVDELIEREEATGSRERCKSVSGESECPTSEVSGSQGLNQFVPDEKYVVRSNADFIAQDVDNVVNETTERNLRSSGKKTEVKNEGEVLTSPCVVRKVKRGRKVHEIVQDDIVESVKTPPDKMTTRKSLRSMGVSAEESENIAVPLRRSARRVGKAEARRHDIVLTDHSSIKKNIGAGSDHSLPAKENQEMKELCGVSLRSSSRKQKAEKFEASISTNSSHKLGASKSEDSIGSIKSNEKVPQNVEACDSEPVCPNTATHMIQENCKSDGSDGTLFSCSVTYLDGEMMDSGTVIGNVGVLSEQENQLEDAPCINEECRSENAIKTNVAPIVDELVDQMLEREEATGSKERCESVSGKSERPTSEVSGSQGLNQFVSDKKCVVGGEANLEPSAQHPIFFMDREMVIGNMGVLSEQKNQLGESSCINEGYRSENAIKTNPAAIVDELVDELIEREEAGSSERGDNVSGKSECHTSEVSGGQGLNQYASEKKFVVGWEANLKPGAQHPISFMGSETVIVNTGILSEQKNELEESSCINEGYRSGNTVKTNVAAILDEVVDELIERKEATGSRERRESVSGESECPTSEVSGSQGLNQFVPDQKYVADGEVNLEPNAHHPVFLDGSTCFVDHEGVNDNRVTDQADAKYFVRPTLESQSFGGNENVTDEIETPGPSENRCLSLHDGYLGISEVDVVQKGNERNVNNLEYTSIARNDDFAHGLRRPENLQSAPSGIAEVSDALIDHEMLINREQVECNGNQGNSRIVEHNVIEGRLISDVQEASALVADDHLASERPKDFQSLPCGGDEIQFALSQVEHGDNGSAACVADVGELQAGESMVIEHHSPIGESMVIEHHNPIGNELDSMACELDASTCKLTIVEATLDALMPDVHGTPGNIVTGVEKLAEATSIEEMGCLVLCHGPFSLINGETDYKDVKINHEENQTKADGIVCSPMVEPRSFEKHEKATNDIERALRHSEDVGRSPILDEAFGKIKDNVSQNDDLGVMDISEDARFTSCDDLAFESLEHSTYVSVLNEDERLNNSEELTANEDQEHCDVSLHSSSMKQKAEKFETSISMNSSPECCTTKSEDFIGSHKSNDKVPENVEARASESVCPNSATYMIPENCKFFGGDGKQFSCSETYPGNEMMGCETVIANMVVMSEQENELEEAPCINERYRSEDAIKTNVAAIVDELVDQLIEREEATGSREKCESVSGESECPTSEVSAKKCVVDGEVAQHPVFLDGSTCFADLEVVKGNCDRDQTDAKCSVYHALESQSFGGNEKVTAETEGLTPDPSEQSCVSLLDGYVRIRKVDVALKGNGRDANNLEDARIARNGDSAPGFVRPENLQSSPSGIAEVSDVRVDHEMCIKCEQVESNGNKACVPDVIELQGGESMVIENHDANGNELGSMAWELDASPSKFIDVEATLDALVPDMHGAPGNIVTGVEKLAEATSIGEIGCLVLCHSPSSLINGETDYEDVKSTPEAKQANADDIACPPMVEPQSFGKHEKATNEIEEALEHAQDVGRRPLLDEAVGPIKENVAQNEDLGVVDTSVGACLTRSDDLAFESLEDSQNLSCGTTDVSVLNDDENSEELTANEDQGFNLPSKNETVDIVPPISTIINSRNSEVVNDMHGNLESTGGSKMFDVCGVKEIALSELSNHSFSMPNQEACYESCKENSRSDLKEVNEGSTTVGTDMTEMEEMSFDALDDKCLSMVDQSIGENNFVVNSNEREHDKSVSSVELGEGSHINVGKLYTSCEIASESSMDNNDNSSGKVGSFSPWPYSLENLIDKLPEHKSGGSISASQELHSTESAYTASLEDFHFHESKEPECNNVEPCMFSIIQQPVNEQKCSDNITENNNGFDEIGHVDSKVLSSATIKRSILIHGTPQKKPLLVHDMKENTLALKTRQMVDVTAVKPPMARRNALEELPK